MSPAGDTAGMSPIVLVHASRSSREPAAGIPGAELRIVPDATHLWNLQQPEAFNLTVAEFVDRAEAAGV